MTWVQPHLPNQALSVPPFPRSRVGSVRRKVCAMRKSHTREIHTQIFCGENPETWLTTQNMNFFYYFLVPFLSLSFFIFLNHPQEKKTFHQLSSSELENRRKFTKFIPFFTLAQCPPLSLSQLKKGFSYFSWAIWRISFTSLFFFVVGNRFHIKVKSFLSSHARPFFTNRKEKNPSRLVDVVSCKLTRSSS